MKARGRTRKMLIAFGKIQDLAGKAQGIYNNDRQPDRAGKLIPILEEIFDICLEERNKYDPVTERKGE